MKYVLFYESADDVASRAPAHFAAHRARWAEFQARGTLLMIGTFANPQADGSMAVFSTREDAEEFARTDPFVLNGVVRRWTIREWNEVLVDTSRETAKLRYACVLSRDIQRLARFYTDVLRAEPRWNGPYAEFPSDRGIFCLWAADAYAHLAGPEAIPKPGAGPVMLEFEVADVDADFTRLSGLSEWAIEFILTPTTMAWGNRSVYFRDIEGNLVNLFSRVG